MTTKEQRKASWDRWAAKGDNHAKYLKKQRERAHNNPHIQTERQRAKYHSDPDYRFRKNMSNRISKALKTQKARKDGTMWDALGCDAKTLRVHLASQFEPGMTFENHGEWHVDHRIPCAALDLRCPLAQLVCFHYSNLQPMWGKENQCKGGRYEA